ncbi:hypothetical protein B0T14DRAFT_427108 [Immersiella caudata]|uniref:Glycosyltransferase n=1 Tax=Immersiella caudata TaxID=314043 RepID=A0AA40C4M4_9PEZI|nr:hypothetical protein B0T14DRAFT_427108 [Immersiella caudata]
MPTPSSLHPLIIMCPFPAAGHINPLLEITTHLTTGGFPVFFLCSDPFTDRVRSAGAEPWPNSSGPLTPETIRGQFALPQGHLRWNYQQKHIFLDGAPERHAILERCLASVQERFPEREVVIFNEVLFLGAVPYLLGKTPPGGKKLKVINFHTTVDWTVKEGCAPYGLVLPPAKGEEERREYARLYEELRPAARETVVYANEMMRSLGAREDVEGDFFFSEVTMLADVVLMACSPSLEYPRDDGHDEGQPMIKYIGGLPRGCSDDETEFLSLWKDLEDNERLPLGERSRKRVVFVSQGTANNDEYGELVIPTMEALGSREDLLVVVTLGKRDASLPASVVVPGNAMVVDHVPYHAVLSIADVFVFNGGYGGLMHAVMSGVPMVIAGTAADKGEVAARAEWAGVAVNLRTSTPIATIVRAAVDKVLDDESFKTKAMELKRENEALDALGRIETQIWTICERSG